LNYIYAIALIVFHFGIYQHPFKDLKYYWVIRISINEIWMFAIFVLIGNCTNFLPLDAFRCIYVEFISPWAWVLTLDIYFLREVPIRTALPLLL
jgi:hypothetical protein